ncbi:MAG: succinyldiaminopimelate transaminase [Kocuria palustris]|nr:MAG: succinyldiaminopimelate transaminase [Kocuria palustris]
MTQQPRAFGLDLPEYPWESVAPYRRIAAEHSEGTVDLSIGTPVDPTPLVVQDALAAASDAPGYPTTHGTPALREAIARWYDRRRGVPGLDPEQIMPTVGSKELVAWLPLLLGLRAGDVVVRPSAAYPTYDIGAQLAGAEHVAADDLDELPQDVLERVRLIWLNSPGNPTGAVADVEAMRATVERARELGAVVASDECYAELGWGEWDREEGGQAVPSVLDPRVSGGDLTGLLSVYSLSKQSNLAGYRAAFVAGGAQIVAGLVNSRKHAGMIVPAPVQAAMRAALDDDAHVVAQKALYRARRERLRSAVEAFGLSIEHSEAGLYLWCRRDGCSAQDTWDLVREFAELGIVVGPGVFYGDAAAGFIRIALTASDERIDAAVARLQAASG